VYYSNMNLLWCHEQYCYNDIHSANLNPKRTDWIDGYRAPPFVCGFGSPNAEDRARSRWCHSVHRPCGHPGTADGPAPGPVPTGRIRPPHPDSLHLRAFVIFVHRNVQLPIVGSGKMFHCERVTSRCSDSDEIPLQRSVYV
jgi:hypothetical protein